MPSRPCLISLPRIADPRGSLSVVQGGEVIPFEIKRAYWIYDVPAGGERGGHAHRAMSQLLVAVAGSFNVNLSDGHSWHTYTLNRPSQGCSYRPASGAHSTTFRRAPFASRLSRLPTTQPTISTITTNSCALRPIPSQGSDPYFHPLPMNPGTRYPFLDLATVNAPYADGRGATGRCRSPRALCGRPGSG